jgi:hypothetical protein
MDFEYGVDPVIHSGKEYLRLDFARKRVQFLKGGCEFRFHCFALTSEFDERLGILQLAGNLFIDI